MKILKYLITALAAPLCVACFDDETTEATRPLSEITIAEGSIKEVYNIGRNETLTISPVLSQSNTAKELEYTWEINQEVYSHDKDFVYTGDRLGTYDCRFIVGNEDGKTFFPFTLNVNSIYEEGLTVISRDVDGASHLAFMLTPTDAAAEAAFYDYECFSVNNPDYRFASNASDIVQTDGSLVISCKGGNEPGDIPTIYFLNEKTFVVENYVTSAEYPDFAPERMLIPSRASDGVSYPVLGTNGKVYELPTVDAVLQPSAKLHNNYSPTCFIVDDGSGLYYDALLWDNDSSALALIYNGYGPYYCSSEYGLILERDSFATYNFFKGRSLVTMTEVKMTKEEKAVYDSEVLVLVNGSVPMPQLQKVVISTCFWVYNYDTGTSYFANNGGLKSAGMQTTLVNESTPCVANKTFHTFLFADGNKVRTWNYTTTQKLTDSAILQTIGSDNAVITDLEMSADNMRVYVAFYEPDAVGKNGSIWVIDTDEGTVCEKYDNVCYRPVKMIYKSK